jgi:hypothetical protein
MIWVPIASYGGTKEVPMKRLNSKYYQAHSHPGCHEGALSG